MTKKASNTALTPTEKSVIKSLLNDGWRNQDIQTLINTGRAASINFGRIAGVKADGSIIPATEQQVKEFQYKKLHFDQVTGLCPIDNERLVRAREAMILAVQLFNTPRIEFKSGVFTMLTNVAWTYLLHEYYERKGVQIVNNQGYSLLLSQMLNREDCPLSKLCKQNLVALKDIRDVVEHRTIGPFDLNWLPLFQSTCLNFEKAMTDFFGHRLSLGRELGFALQFSKLKTEDIATLQNFELPQHIAALDASLKSKVSGEDADNLEYQFKVVYTLTSASKANAHFQFVQPDSDEGKEIQNVLIKYKPVDDIWPLKPADVIEKVKAASSRNFTSDKHRRAWKLYKCRPVSNAAAPAVTDKRYCLYHQPYKSYTYSHAWVDFLTSEITDDKKWDALKKFDG